MHRQPHGRTSGHSGGSDGQSLRHACVLNAVGACMQDLPREHAICTLGTCKHPGEQTEAHTPDV
jgi:hypothetical protein